MNIRLVQTQPLILIIHLTLEPNYLPIGLSRPNKSLLHIQTQNCPYILTFEETYSIQSSSFESTGINSSLFTERVGEFSFWGDKEGR